MPNPLQPHPFAALFPELPPEELTQLARDIKERGQLEPIILYKGVILDGRNRYRACQIAGVKPRIEEFNAKATKRSPEEFVLSRNLRRRHLSVGQKAAIALEWSDQIELSPEPEKNKERGRPKGALSEAAKYIGINEQRVFEVRQIRDANPSLYQDVKAGRRSLNGALAEVSPPGDTRFRESGLGESGAASQELDGSAKHEIRQLAQPAGGKVARGAQKPARKEAAAAVKLLPSPAAIEKALARIKKILGNWFYADDVHVHIEVQGLQGGLTLQGISMAEEWIAPEQDHGFHRVGMPGEDSAIHQGSLHHARVSRGGPVGARPGRAAERFSPLEATAFL
jgi:ParB-like nuclease domain